MFITGILAMFGKTNNSMIRILQAYPFDFLQNKCSKKINSDLLKALVKTTDNTIDDKIVEMSKRKLWPSL